MLGKSGQRVLKAIHVASAGVWLGGLLAIIVVLAAGPSAPPGRARFGLDLAAFTVHGQLLTWAFAITLATGLVFALWTPWGFVRHRWIAVKWLLAVLLFAITLVLQAPAVTTVVALADAGAPEIDGVSYADGRTLALALAVGQLAVVLAVFAISALKPWGLRRGTWTVPRRLALSLIAGGLAVGVAALLWSRISLDRLRRPSVPSIDIATVPDGRWRGTAPADCGFGYVVEVEVARGRLVDARTIVNRDAVYARLATAVLPRMVAAQRLEVDAITGATTTSRCMMRAVARGLAEVTHRAGRSSAGQP